MSIKDADDWEGELLADVGQSTIIALQEAEHVVIAEDQAAVCTEREADKRKTLGRSIAPVLRGHVLEGRPTFQAALLLPNKIADDLVWRSYICPEFAHVTRTTAVVLGASGVITCYFRHSANADPLLSACLAEVDSMLTYMRLKHKI